VSTGQSTVTCIMPTRERRAFVPRAIRMFLSQDYEKSELLILDDGEDAVGDLVPDHPRIRYLRHSTPITIGAKRNILCEEAKTEFIVHWDDDDWYASDRIRVQVEAMQARGVVAAGTSTHYYYEPSAGRAWRYWFPMPVPFVTGTTLAYRKAYWRDHAFVDLQVGEDWYFIQSMPPASLVDLARPTLCVGTVHPGNVCPKQRYGVAWIPVPLGVIEEILGDAYLRPKPAVEESGENGWGSSERVFLSVETSLLPASNEVPEDAAQDPGAAATPRPKTDPSVRRVGLTDCLGRTELTALGEPARGVCVAIAATEGYADWLEGALASLVRFGGLSDMTPVVFVEGEGPRCSATASRYGARIVKCRLLGGPPASIKAALYSVSRVVASRQYLCLDADVLVVDTLADLLKQHAALPLGTVLAARQVGDHRVALGSEGTAAYGATAAEVDDLRVSFPWIPSHEINDGVFVADASALARIDEFLRATPAVADWVQARPEAWQRQRTAFTVALGALGTFAPMGEAYNVRLQRERPRYAWTNGRHTVEWQGRLVKVLHFSGTSKSTVGPWKRLLLR
jgi:hypothetical protein